MDIIMRKVIQIDEQVQAAKSKEGKYLTFAFFEKGNGSELKVVGWTQLWAWQGKPDNIIGIIKPWGYGIPVVIPVKKIRYPRGTDTTGMSETTCIVIFEYSKPYKYYLAITAESIAHVMNIAEKDAATTVITETMISNEHNGNQFEYRITAANKSGKIKSSNREITVIKNMMEHWDPNVP